MSKNCIIYSRVSTDNQNNESAINDLTLYAKYSNLNLIKVFEEVVSGKTKAVDREIFNKLIDFIEHNDVDTILVWELSRLGRNLKDVLNTIEILTDKKINIYSKMDNLNTLNPDKSINHQASLILGVLGSVAQFERSAIVERSKRGLHYHLKNGGAFSLSPYGYDNKEKKIVINEAESEIVKEIFRLFNSGYASPKIAKLLNYRNIPSKKGCKWSDTQIRDILHNTMYYGERKYNFGIVNVPSIVSKEDFIIAQEQFNNNSNLNKDKTIFTNYLSGKIECGICGLSYYQHARKSKKDFAYKCMSNRLKTIGQIQNSCSNNGIGINLLNSMVYMSLLSDMLSSDCDEYRTKFWKSINDDVEMINQEIEIYENEINNKKKKLKRLLKLIVDDTISKKDYLNEKFILESDIQKINSKLNKLIIEKTKTTKNETTSFELEFDNLKIMTMDKTLYLFYVDTILKSVLIDKCSTDEFKDVNKYGNTRIFNEKKENITKIIVNTLFDSHIFYTIKGNHKYSYRLMKIEEYYDERYPGDLDYILTEIEIVECVSQ